MSQNINTPAHKVLYKKAFLHDRMAAFVVDFAIVFLLHSILASYIKYRQNLAFVEGFHFSFSYWLSLNLFSFFVIYFLYHFLLFKKMNATVGKKIFHIRTLDIWSLKPMSDEQIMKYSLYKTFHFLTLGFGFIALFTDKKRRCFHEKMSDTASYTIKNRYDLGPSIKEIKFFKGFFLPFKLSFFFMIAFVLYQISFEVDREEMMSVLELPAQPICEDLNEYMKSPDQHSRMEAALSLFLLGELHSECLEVEAQAAFESKEDVDLAFLAFSLIRPQKAKAYISEVCKRKVNQGFCSDDPENKMDGYEKLWQAKLKFRDKKYKQAYEQVLKIQNPFLVSHLDLFRLQLLSKLGKSKEIEFSLKNFKNTMGEEEYAKSVSWMCEEEIKKDCDANSYACKELQKLSDLRGYHRNVQISYVELKLCNQDASPMPLGMDESVKDFFYAKWRQIKSNSTRDLRDLSTSDLYPIEVRLAAAKSLLPKNASASFQQVVNLLSITSERKPASSEDQ